jgi:hypothetical protein
VLKILYFSGPAWSGITIDMLDRIYEIPADQAIKSSTFYGKETG